jgi:hypothetical protein
MNITHIYQGLTPYLRDRFCSEVFTLGLIHELNQAKYEAHCRRLIKQHNGSSRTLYKAMMKLDLEQRKRFFDVISGVLEHELTN